MNDDIHILKSLVAADGGHPSEAAALSRLEALAARLAEENAELTKALTGLTCGGSEFFNRKGDRYVADTKACVDYIQRRDRSAHETIVRFSARAKAAESLNTTLASRLKEAEGALHAAWSVLVGLGPDWPADLAPDEDDRKEAVGLIERTGLLPSIVYQTINTDAALKEPAAFTKPKNEAE